MKRNLSETFYRTLQWRNSVVVFFFFKDNSMYILYGSNRPVKHSTLFLPLFRTPPTTESILTDMKESQQRLRKERARDPIQFFFFVRESREPSQENQIEELRSGVRHCTSLPASPIPCISTLRCGNGGDKRYFREFGTPMDVGRMVTDPSPKTGDRQDQSRKKRKKKR